MSITQVPIRPIQRGSMLRLWLAILFLAVLAWVVARAGAGALRPQMTPGGIALRTIEPGHGDPITLADAALVDYVGSLDDGTVFDAAANHGGPQPMAPAEMMPGFREAMLNMREGGKYHVRIPPAQGYGMTPPPGIPANATLTFDVAILKIGRNAAAMAAAQARQQQQAPPEQPPAITDSAAR